MDGGQVRDAFRTNRFGPTVYCRAASGFLLCSLPVIIFSLHLWPIAAGSSPRHAREIADGRAIALEHIVDTIDQRYQQEAIKKALVAREETRKERKRKSEEAAKTEAQHMAKAAAQKKLRARKGDMEPARPLMFSQTRDGAIHHTQRAGP